MDALYQMTIIVHKTFQISFLNLRLLYFVLNFTVIVLQMSICPSVSINSGTGLRPTGAKPSPEAMMTRKIN